MPLYHPHQAPNTARYRVPPSPTNEPRRPSSALQSKSKRLKRFSRWRWRFYWRESLSDSTRLESQPTRLSPTRENRSRDVEWLDKLTPREQRRRAVETRSAQARGTRQQWIARGSSLSRSLSWLISSSRSYLSSQAPRLELVGCAYVSLYAYVVYPHTTTILILILLLLRLGN